MAVTDQLNNVAARIQSLRPGILSQGPVRKMLGLNTGGGPRLMDLAGRTSGASGPAGWRPSFAPRPPGVAITKAGYREGVGPRPRTWNGYRFTS